MANLYDEHLLTGMKRSELQKLAKKHGIKANMKTDDLIKALAVVADPCNDNEDKVGSPARIQPEVSATASSTEDQSETEVPEKKRTKARGRRGRKQKNIKEQSEESSPEKKVEPSIEAPKTAPSPVHKTETEVSTATEDEKASPAAKKSKAKTRGRGRGRGRRGKKAEEESADTSTATEDEQKVPVAAETVTSPAAGCRSQGKQSTPAPAQALLQPSALPTPPNSGSSTRRIKKASRRSTFTPPPASKGFPTPPAEIPEASSQAPSSSKRTPRSASRGASKPLQTPTPTPCPQEKAKTPLPASQTKTRGSTGTKTRGSTGKKSASGSAGKKSASGSAGKKSRRGTFDKSPSKEAPKEQAKSSSSTSLRDEIMAEIDRKVQLQVAKTKSGIPTLVKPVKKTPSKRNWTKAHHGAFDKMESIDDYLERKRRRVDAISASKKPRTPAAKPSGQPKSISFMSPKPNKPTAATNNPKSAKTVSFRVSKLKTPKKATLPSFVSSTANLEKRQATPGVRKSVSVLTPAAGSQRRSVGSAALNRKSLDASKTPSRKSVGAIKTPSRKSLGALKTPSRKSLGALKTPSRKSIGGITPGAATSTTKNNFDLKASLSKPLSYKPHTGKLKPFGESQVNAANQKPSNISTARTLIKKPQLKGRADRRAVQMKHRAQRRDDSFMAKRGISGI